jgi:hypothetical protein
VHLLVVQPCSLPGFLPLIDKCQTLKDQTVFLFYQISVIVNELDVSVVNYLRREPVVNFGGLRCDSLQTLLEEVVVFGLVPFA